MLILQHPLERRHRLNTGRLARLGLQNAALWTGEHFPRLAETIADTAAPYLLFPTPDAVSVGSEADAPSRRPTLLIVPDGTWRQARGLLRANPVLLDVPGLLLPAGKPSRYRIRKAREPGALATIEAIARMLAILEPSRDFRPILRPFDRLIEQQIEAMGPEVYHSHHASRHEEPS